MRFDTACIIKVKGTLVGLAGAAVCMVKEGGVEKEGQCAPDWMHCCVTCGLNFSNFCHPVYVGVW